MQESSVFSISSLALTLCRLFDDDHSDLCEVVSHCSFDLHFSNELDHPKKQDSSRKTSISALLTMPKLLTVWITINCGKF